MAAYRLQYGTLDSSLFLSNRSIDFDSLLILRSMLLIAN